MQLRVTTGWDDGHVLDLRVAEILERYGLSGTFYIAREFITPRLTDAQVREMAIRHEIGAHTMTHPVLTEISLEDARTEIAGSKVWLEDVIGQGVNSFCYPKGAQNVALQSIVRDAGYTMARTVEKFHTQPGDNHYAVPTTLQVYPYPFRPMPDIAWWRGWRTRSAPLLDSLRYDGRLALRLQSNWRDYVLAWAKYAHETGGVLHLWGHSWEIEQYGMWSIFEETLAALTQRYDCIPLINADLVTG